MCGSHLLTRYEPGHYRRKQAGGTQTSARYLATPQILLRRRTALHPLGTAPAHRTRSAGRGQRCVPGRRLSWSVYRDSCAAAEGRSERPMPCASCSQQAEETLANELTYGPAVFASEGTWWSPQVPSSRAPGSPPAVSLSTSLQGSGGNFPVAPLPSADETRLIPGALPGRVSLHGPPPPES